MIARWPIMVRPVDARASRVHLRPGGDACEVTAGR